MFRTGQDGGRRSIGTYLLFQDLYIILYLFIFIDIRLDLLISVDHGGVIPVSQFLSDQGLCCVR